MNSETNFRKNDQAKFEELPDPNTRNAYSLLTIPENKDVFRQVYIALEEDPDLKKAAEDI